MCVWWSGREWNLSTVRGVTGAPSASAYSLKKNAIFVSRGVSCIVLSGPPSPTGPAPAGRRNLQNLRATSQIYRKFGAPPTLHHFTRKNRHFTHFTALYTGFRPLSGLHTHVAHRSPMYLGAYRFFGTERARCSLPVHSPPPSSCLGGLPLPDRLSEHSHP